jgi:hypothetical protein
MSCFFSLLYDVAYIRAANISCIFVVFIVSGTLHDRRASVKMLTTSWIVSACASRHSWNEIHERVAGVRGVAVFEVDCLLDDAAFGGQHLVNSSSLSLLLRRLYMI